MARSIELIFKKQNSMRQKGPRLSSKALGLTRTYGYPGTKGLSASDWSVPWPEVPSLSISRI